MEIVTNQPSRSSSLVEHCNSNQRGAFATPVALWKKLQHPTRARRAFARYNEKKATGSGRRTDSISEEVEQMRLYCAAHRSTPSAIRQPHLFRREQLWIALLGPNAEQGIVGIGPSIEAALSNFDAQYLAYLHPPGPASAILPKNEIGNAIRPRTRGNNFNAVG